MSQTVNGKLQDVTPKPSIYRLIFLKIVTLTTIISFLWSGLFINLMQLINYLTIRRINFSLFTKINYYLMYSAWSQIVALFDWFFGSKFRVYHEKSTQEESLFANHNIFLANHGYELDWVAAWLVTDKFGHMASCKAMIKNDLKYIPVVGWSWALSDQLFLDRNWEKDKHKLGYSIDTLLKYQPMVATFFCEGTRFTKDKVAECQKFAAERGLKAPKYHLIPRTKGFVAVVKLLKERAKNDPNLKVCITDAQVAFDERGAMNIGDVVGRGMKPNGCMYFRQMKLEEVPDNEEDCAKWLHNLYLQKDNLQEYFNEHHTFPGLEDSRFVNYKPRVSTFANWLLWQLYTFGCVALLVSSLYSKYGTFLVSAVVSTFFILSYIYLNWIMYQADVEDSEQAIKKKAT